MDSVEASQVAMAEVALRIAWQKEPHRLRAFLSVIERNLVKAKSSSVQLFLLTYKDCMNWRWPQGEPEYPKAREMLKYATEPPRQDSTFDQVEKSAVATILNSSNPSIRGLAAQILLSKRDLTSASRSWGADQILGVLKREKGQPLEFWRFVQRVFDGRNPQVTRP
jgi:hypothetical protein